MSVKVCKFGGTAMADAEIIKSVKQIIESDETRRYIVVSAPGKRYKGDEKITDLLLLCHDELQIKGTCQTSFNTIRLRFLNIARQLNLAIDFNCVLDETLKAIEREKSKEFTASRGEYLCGILIAEYLGIPFIDAERVIIFNDDGTLNADKTYRAVAFALKGVKRAVIPGYYGADESGKIRTFSRGGSDISGAIVARAMDAALYENWTDVSGFLACDPQIVDSPVVIDELSYGEVKQLSLMGATVLHSECIYPVQSANIPIVIKNAFRPNDRGTRIVPTLEFSSGRAVTGIAGKRNIFENTAQIAVVGHGVKSANTCARLFKAIAAADIKINMLDMASGINVIIGVGADDYERCIKAIYYEFFK